MITKIQQAQIKEFLLSKKLPADLILELKDHFNIQISKIMSEENTSFDEAFLKTKMIWEKDFKMRRRGFFSFEKLPLIAVRYQREENLNLLKRSSSITFFLLFIHIFGTKILEKEYYFILNAGIYGFINVLLPISIILTYFTLNFRQIFVHQQSRIYKTHIPVFTFILLFTVISRIGYLPTNDFKIAFDFINFKSFDAYIFAASVFKISINYFTFIYLYQIMGRRWKENFKMKKIISN